MGRMTRFILGAGAATAAFAMAAPTYAAWSKSYLIQWFEPAMYFPDPKGGRDRPGEDCPKGINPENDWLALLTKPYRPVEKVKEILDPEYPNRQAMYAQFPLRGPNGENVYEKPWLVPDPGMLEVEGKYAYGFDLDGNPNTGFTSPDGKVKGVDNAFYKSSGCILRWRGPSGMGGSSQYSNDGMHDGVYSIVLVLSGEGDPNNDADARLGIYLAKDKMVKDALGGIAANYTFRVDPKPQFQSVLKVKVKDGVVTTTEPQKILMRDYQTPGFFPKELALEKAQLRVEMLPNGNLKGMFGGYRDWREHYRGTSGNGSWGSGAIHENLGKFQLPAWWYAMKRNADGMKDPATGEMRGISTTYAIDAIPAFVVSPDAKILVTQARLFEEPAQQVSDAR